MKPHILAIVLLAASSAAYAQTQSGTGVGTSGATAAPLPDRSSGRCDTLTGQERTQCLREQASSGTAGAGSVGGGAGGGLK